MARKRITIIEIAPSGAIFRSPPKHLQKNFASYAAVARTLKEGTTAMINVQEQCGENFWINMGYGEVVREHNGYSYPRRLMPEY